MNADDTPNRRPWRWPATVVIVLLVAVAVAAIVPGRKSKGSGSGQSSVSLPSVPAVVGTATTGPGSVPRRDAPVDARQLAAARTAAATFLAGYLPYLYGRARPRTISNVSAGLRAKLASQPPRVTPAQRSRHPRLIALSAIGRQPGQVLATATITDGGAAPYSIRLIIGRTHGRWLVTAIPS